MWVDNFFLWYSPRFMLSTNLTKWWWHFSVQDYYHKLRLPGKKTSLELFGFILQTDFAYWGGASGKEPTCHCKRHMRVWNGSFRGGSDSKESVCCGRPGFNPWVRKIPWRKTWQPTPVFLPDGLHSVGLQKFGQDGSNLVQRTPFNLPVMNKTPVYNEINLYIF